MQRVDHKPIAIIICKAVVDVLISHLREINIILTGDNAFADLKDRPEDIIHAVGRFTLAVLEGGMQSGRASVMFREWRGFWGSNS